MYVIVSLQMLHTKLFKHSKTWSQIIPVTPGMCTHFYCVEYSVSITVLMNEQKKVTNN